MNEVGRADGLNTKRWVMTSKLAVEGGEGKERGKEGKPRVGRGSVASWLCWSYGLPAPAVVACQHPAALSHFLPVLTKPHCPPVSSLALLPFPEQPREVRAGTDGEPHAQLPGGATTVLPEAPSCNSRTSRSLALQLTPYTGHLRGTDGGNSRPGPERVDSPQWVDGGMGP